MKTLLAVAALSLSLICEGQVRLGGAVKADGSDSGGGAGTVTTTGSPASGQVAAFSGASSVTGDSGLTAAGSGDTRRLIFGASADVSLQRYDVGLLGVFNGDASAFAGISAAYLSLQGSYPPPDCDGSTVGRIYGTGAGGGDFVLCACGAIPGFLGGPPTYSYTAIGSGTCPGGGGGGMAALRSRSGQRFALFSKGASQWPIR